MASRSARRSRSPLPAWSRTASPTSCGRRRSTTSSSACGRSGAEMRIESFDWDGADPAALAQRIRALQPRLGEVSGAVTGIIDDVREGGDTAVAEIESRLGGTPVSAEGLRQPEDAVRGAASRLAPELVDALETAAANIRAVAEAQLAGDARVVLDQGQAVELREVPVGSAGIYAPGGAAPYPSTVLMGCIPAKV